MTAAPRALRGSRGRPRAGAVRPVRHVASSHLFRTQATFKPGAGSAAPRWEASRRASPAQPWTPGGFKRLSGRGGESTLKELGWELRGSLPGGGGGQELSRPGGEGPWPRGGEAPGVEKPPG